MAQRCLGATCATLSCVSSASPRSAKQLMQQQSDRSKHPQKPWPDTRTGGLDQRQRSMGGPCAGALLIVARKHLKA
jgi:hypothetical protein